MAKQEVVLPGRENRMLNLSSHQGAQAIVDVNGRQTNVPLGKVVALEEEVIQVLKDSRWRVLSPEEYKAQLEALEAKKDRAAERRGEPEADRSIRKLEGRARA